MSVPFDVKIGHLQLWCNFLVVSEVFEALLHTNWITAKCPWNFAMLLLIHWVFPKILPTCITTKYKYFLLISIELVLHATVFFFGASAFKNTQKQSLNNFYRWTKRHFFIFTLKTFDVNLFRNLSFLEIFSPFHP